MRPKAEWAIDYYFNIFVFKYFSYNSFLAQILRGSLHVWNLSQARDNAPAFRSRLLVLRALNFKHILCSLSPLFVSVDIPIILVLFSRFMLCSL